MGLVSAGGGGEVGGATPEGYVVLLWGDGLFGEHTKCF